MAVDLITPKEFVGEILGNLASRSGIILNHESKLSFEHIRAEVPLVNMFGYSTSLRNASQGRATFSMEFSHFTAKESGLQ